MDHRHSAYSHDHKSKLVGLRNYITHLPDDFNTSSSAKTSYGGPDPLTDRDSDTEEVGGSCDPDNDAAAGSVDTEGIWGSCDPDNNAAVGCVAIDAGAYCDATIPSGSDAARSLRGQLEGEEPEPAQWEHDTAFETEGLIVPEIDGKRLLYARYLTRAYASHVYTLFRTLYYRLGR